LIHPIKRLRRCPCPRWPWFWEPCLYWYGLTTLSPVHLGNDEYHRRTIMLGWTITGRVIIPLWHFRGPCDPETPWCGTLCEKCGMIDVVGMVGDEPVKHQCPKEDNEREKAA